MRGARIASVSSPLEGSTLANVTTGEYCAQKAEESPSSPGSVGTEGGKATRTYTGAALARRKAWGKQWGEVGKRWKIEHANEGK